MTLANFLMGWWFVIILIVLLIITLKYKHFKHRVFIILVILLVLFLYVSFSAVISESEANLSSFSGLLKVGKAYYLWLGNAFNNIKFVVGNALKMDWGVNETVGG